MISVVVLLVCGAWSSVGGAAPKVSSGEVRSVGRTLETAEGGATFELASQSIVHLAPRSSISYGRTKVWFPKHGVKQCHVITLNAGSLRVQTSADEPIVVRSKRLTVAALDGALAAGAEAAMGLRGTAWVRKKGTWRRLVERQRVGLTPTGDVAPVASVLPAPQLGPTRVLTAPTGRAELGKVRWDAVGGALHYWLTVSRRASDREMLHGSYGALTSEERLPDLQPGRYVVSVTAIDERGLPGVPANIDVTVVGVQSDGAVPDPRGGVLVEPQTPVRLTHIDGLEMKLGDSTEWFPAVSSLNLRQGELAVHLRDPHSRATARLDVGLKQHAPAAVHIGPKTALWPEDQVVASIALGAGNVDTSLRIESQVGTTPIELDWKRQGTTLTAVIPKPQAAGPWVVRIAVFDEDGVLLGRDNLEVACQAKAVCAAPMIAVRGKETSTERHTAKR